MSMINEYRMLERFFTLENEVAKMFGYEESLPELSERLKEASRRIASKYTNVEEVTSESIRLNPIAFDEYKVIRLGAIALSIDDTLELNLHRYSMINKPELLEIVKKSKGKRPYVKFRITFSKNEIIVEERGKVGNSEPFSELVRKIIDHALEEYDVKPVDRS